MIFLGLSFIFLNSARPSSDRLLDFEPFSFFLLLVVPHRKPSLFLLFFPTLPYPLYVPYFLVPLSFPPFVCPFRFCHYCYPFSTESRIYFRLLYLPTHLRKPNPPRLDFERGSAGENPLSNIMTFIVFPSSSWAGAGGQYEIGRSCAAGAGFRTRAGGRGLPFGPVQPQLQTAVQTFGNSATTTLGS